MNARRTLWLGSAVATIVRIATAATYPTSIADRTQIAIEDVLAS